MKHPVVREDSICGTDTWNEPRCIPQQKRTRGKVTRPRLKYLPIFLPLPFSSSYRKEEKVDRVYFSMFLPLKIHIPLYIRLTTIYIYISFENKFFRIIISIFQLSSRFFNQYRNYFFLEEYRLNFTFIFLFLPEIFPNLTRLSASFTFFLKKYKDIQI